MTPAPDVWRAEPVLLPKVADLVVQDLRRRIAHGEFGEDATLPQALELMRTYRVSRPTLREAYRVLEAERLIERSTRNRSVYFVRPPSLDVAARHVGLLLQLRGATLGDLHRAKMIIEGPIGDLLVRRSARRRVDGAAPGLSEPEGIQAANTHESVALLTGNRTLSTLVGLLDSIVAMHCGQPLPGGTIGACPDQGAHHGVGELIANGRSDDAATRWHQHVHDVARRVLGADSTDTPVDVLQRAARPAVLPPAESLANELRRQIVSGELNEGARLATELLLREEHGVSRTTLREALRILETEGLVRVHRGARGGATAHHPHPQSIATYVGLLLQTRGASIADFLEARSILEPPLAGIAASRRAPIHVRTLTDALMHEAAVVAHEPERFAQLAVEFHERIAEASESPTLTVLLAILNAIVERAAPVRLDDHTHPGRAERVHAEHAAVTEHIESGDAVGAEKIWRQHCSPSADSVETDSQHGVIDLFA